MTQCYFCTNNVKEIDYKEAETLKRFLDSQSKILSKEKTGLCAKHQRKMAKAIKNARILGLLPFVSR
jgi:small subunit ribosomal protein S18